MGIYEEARLVEQRLRLTIRIQPLDHHPRGVDFAAPVHQRPGARKAQLGGAKHRGIRNLLQYGHGRARGLQLLQVERNREQRSPVHISEVAFAARRSQITPESSSALQGFPAVVRQRYDFNLGVIKADGGIFGGEEDRFAAGQDLRPAMRPFFSLQAR